MIDMYPRSLEFELCVLVRCKLSMSSEQLRKLRASTTRFHSCGDDEDINELRRLRSVE